MTFDKDDIFNLVNAHQDIITDIANMQTRLMEMINKVEVCHAIIYV